MDFDNQTKEIYELIGQYVVAFEECCEIIRMFITSILATNGLKNEILSQVLVSEVTAKKLGNCLVALLYESCTLTDNEELVVRKFNKFFQKACEQRNKFLHAFWFIGGNAFTHAPKTSISNSKLTKSGLDHRHEELDADGLREYITYTCKLNLYIKNMHAYFVLKICYKQKSLDIKKFFDIEKNKAGVSVDVRGEINMFNRFENEVDNVHNADLNRSAGFKGSINKDLIILARNSNDVWYFIFSDHAESDWAQASLRSLLYLIPNALGVIAKETLLVKQNAEWVRIDYDWKPESEESISSDILKFLVKYFN